MLSLSLVLALTLTDASGLSADVPPGSPADVVPSQLQNIDVVEHLGAELPKDLTFIDSEGRRVQLKDYFDGVHPVVFTLAYYRCQMLCGLVLTGTAKSLKKTGLEFGKDYKALTISINPKENAALAAEAQRGTTSTLIAGHDAKDA